MPKKKMGKKVTIIYDEFSYLPPEGIEIRIPWKKLGLDFKRKVQKNGDTMCVVTQLKRKKNI